jgi:hypothetical protein
MAPIPRITIWKRSGHAPESGNGNGTQDVDESPGVPTSGDGCTTERDGEAGGQGPRAKAWIRVELQRKDGR